MNLERAEVADEAAGPLAAPAERVPELSSCLLRFLDSLRGRVMFAENVLLICVGCDCFMLFLWVQEAKNSQAKT